MRYNYNSELEAFQREDGLGKKIWINSVEAQRIVTLKELGYSIGEICSKIQFNSGKVYESTVINFLRNVDEGNIIVSNDYPAPKQVVRDLTIEEKYNNLENRVNELEARMSEIKSDCFITGFAGEKSEKSIDKVKSWLRI